MVIFSPKLHKCIRLRYDAKMYFLTDGRVSSIRTSQSILPVTLDPNRIIQVVRFRFRSHSTT